MKQTIIHKYINNQINVKLFIHLFLILFKICSFAKKKKGENLVVKI